jgi:hypothetical protein
MTPQDVIDLLLKRFGEDVLIRVIAQYAEDEYFIPYDMAVMLIYDAVKS